VIIIVIAGLDAAAWKERVVDQHAVIVIDNRILLYYAIIVQEMILQ